jgi:hypothetical protein
MGKLLTSSWGKTRIMLLVITLVGIAIIGYGSYLISVSAFTSLTSPIESWSQPYVHEWSGLGLIVGYFITYPGLLLTFIGGLIGRERYIWIAFMIIGLYFCFIVITSLTALEIRQHIYPNFLGFPGIIITLLFLLPGFACIFEGILITTLRKKARKAPSG